MRSSASTTRLTQKYLKAGHSKSGFCSKQTGQRSKCVFCNAFTAKNWYLGDGGYCCYTCRKKAVETHKQGEIMTARLSAMASNKRKNEPRRLRNEVKRCATMKLKTEEDVLKKNKKESGKTEQK